MVSKPGSHRLRSGGLLSFTLLLLLASGYARIPFNIAVLLVPTVRIIFQLNIPVWLHSEANVSVCSGTFLDEMAYSVAAILSLSVAVSTMLKSGGLSSSRFLLSAASLSFAFLPRIMIPSKYFLAPNGSIMTRVG